MSDKFPTRELARVLVVRIFHACCAMLGNNAREIHSVPKDASRERHDRVRTVVIFKVVRDDLHGEEQHKKYSGVDSIHCLGMFGMALCGECCHESDPNGSFSVVHGGKTWRTSGDDLRALRRYQTNFPWCRDIDYLLIHGDLGSSPNGRTADKKGQ